MRKIKICLLTYSQPKERCCVVASLVKAKFCEESKCSFLGCTDYRSYMEIITYE